MALSITTASTVVTVDAFRVQQETLQYELRGELARGATAFVTYGDRGKRPTPLVIECEVQKETVASTMSDISDILDAAKDAVRVTTPRGDRDVRGVVWHELRHDMRSVVLTLAFAPGNASYVNAGTTLVNAGTTLVNAGSG